MANVEMVIDSVRVSMMHQVMKGGTVSGLGDAPRMVVLKEKEGPRYMPIMIGTAEADAIAAKMEGVEPARPLTHDFACAAVDALGGSVQSVVISRVQDGCFYAKVIIQAEKGQSEIDCRPSDALAVALRRDAPVFADEDVLQETGMLLDEETGTPSVSHPQRVPVVQRADEGSLGVFSEDVKDILAASEAEARHMHNDYISTGHLLIALAKKKSTAAKIMKDAGANLGKTQKSLRALLRKEGAVEGGGVGLTAALKEAVQISVDEAKRLGSEAVLPEHILLALIRASDGVASDHLRDLGITPETVYTELVRLHKRS